MSSRSVQHQIQTDVLDLYRKLSFPDWNVGRSRRPRVARVRSRRENANLSRRRTTQRRQRAQRKTGFLCGRRRRREKRRGEAYHGDARAWGFAECAGAIPGNWAVCWCSRMSACEESQPFRGPSTLNSPVIHDDHRTTRRIGRASLPASSASSALDVVTRSTLSTLRSQDANALRAGFDDAGRMSGLRKWGGQGQEVGGNLHAGADEVSAPADKEG
jgi:hypothetical protein